MSGIKNFAVIDIGTNAVKCKLFSDGKDIFQKNKILSRSSARHLDKDGSKLSYSEANKVSVKSANKSAGNDLYEDMILNAKNNGQKYVKFNDNVSLDTKLRIYSACVKYGFKVKNFEYNEKMLEQVSAKTKAIVQNALKNHQNSSGIGTKSNRTFVNRQNKSKLM